MLYHLYDAAYAAMLPARWTAATTRLLFSNPFSPMSYTFTGRVLNAGATVFDDITERRQKPEWNIDDVHIDVMDRRPFCNLLRFSRRERNHYVPSVLLVAPLSGHHATLLRGTVEAVVADHDVYVTDWLDARDIPLSAGPFALDDNIEYIMDYIRMLGPNVHLIAVCQPAPAVLTAVALLAAAGDPAQPRTMTLMGGPIDVNAAPTAPTKLAASKPLDWFAKKVITKVPGWYRGAGRKVYPGFLQIAAFMSMNPERHFEAHFDMFEHMAKGDAGSAVKQREFYDEYFATMDVEAEYYLDTIDRVFQRTLLANGGMTVRGIPVEPRAIEKTALLTIEGELDDVSAPGQTYAAHALCSGLAPERHEHHLQKGVGHYGIFNGRRWRQEVMGVIHEFVRTHDG